MTTRSIIFIALTLIIGCKQKHTDTQIPKSPFKNGLPNTIISGKIENASSEFVVLSKDQFHDTVKLDAQNQFKFNLHITEPVYFNFSDGKSRLKIYVEPKNEFSITYNANKVFNSIEFEGKGAEPNIYLKEKYLLMLDQYIPLDHLYEQPEKIFRHYVDSFYVISKLYLDEFISENSNLSTYFRETELASITYNRAAQLIEYLNATSHLNEINEADYLRFLKNLSVNEKSLLEVYEYKLFLSAYIEYYAGKNNRLQNLNPYEITLTKLQTVSTTIDNQEIKDYLLFTFLKDHVKYYGYKNTELLFKTFEYQCKNEQMKHGLLTPYSEYVKLSKKQKAPEIKLIDANGANLLLSEFKGTYIYIDVWATWCMPCRKEVSYFDELKSKYKHKNIEFLSISIDKKREDWLEFLTLKKLNTNHFITSDIEHFLDDYQIKTIPHFLIIDDKGNLINNDAPRPSDKKTDWLDELPDRIEV